ncbi:unnamed protein product [Symbiodinium sp. CCMP2456]|nr:unnamed protein product [Symbiodinium sp. CCMP2456]
MFRMGFFQGIIVALLAPIIAEKGTDLEDSLLEALGQEIDSEDCSLLNEGPSCQASAFLQTGAALRWSELKTEKAELPRISAPLSFLELQEETSEAAVGEVHSSSTAEEVGERSSQKVGEVHMDRSQELLRQWQEDGVELYAAAQAAPSVGGFASEATEALKSGLAGHPAKGITGFSLCIALLVVVSVASLAAVLYWGPWLWKLDPQVPQWLPEALSQDLVACEAQAPKVPELEEGPPKQPSLPSDQAGRLEKEAKAQTGPSSRQAEAGLQDRLRQLILEAVVCKEENLEQVLPSAAGYDCALSKPVSSGCAVKMLCRIEGALPGGPPPLGLLRAPLSQRSCVLFRAVAEGALPKKSQEAVDFQVSLVSAPWIRIDVLGHEVKLLETSPLAQSDQELFTPYQAFKDLPKHWKHFVSPLPEPKVSFLPLPPPPAATSPSAERELFRFREDLLQVGSEVILCGELIRDSSGRIFLQPWQENFENSSWRTSWELEGCPDLRPAVLATTEAALMEAPGKVPMAESCFDEFAVMVP